MRWTCWIAARIAARTNDLDADGEVVWSWSPDAETKLRGTIRAMKGQQSPVPGESSKDTVKTIVQGMPDDLAEPVVTAASFSICWRAMGCGQHPAFPAPSCSRDVFLG